MSEAAAAILGRQELDRFIAAGPIKRGLPRAAYTDPAFFDLEMRTVFARTWVFVGFTHEIASPGDLWPARAGAAPVLLVRGHDNDVRAFHNVCRHRGSKLVDRPCNAKLRIVCPYHAWSYGLDGSLKTPSNFGGPGVHGAEGFEPAKHGLVPIRCTVWHDWILVNLDGKAPPFEDYVRPLEAKLRHIDFEALKPIIHIDSGVLDANWKFPLENYIEPYHVPVVHPETAAGQPLADHYVLPRDGFLVGCGIDRRGAAGDRDVRRAVFLDFSAHYLLLFPNFALFVYYGDETQVTIMHNTPLAADRNHQRRVIYQMGGVPPSPAMLAEWIKLNEDVVAEDWAMLRRLQEGRASPVLDDGGVLSPVWETADHDFESLVIECMR